MADKSFADLLREAGVQPSGAIQYAQSLNRPVPYRSYTPPRPLPRRMRPADVRAYDDNPGVAQQAMSEMRRDRMTGQDAMLREAQGPASNQFADAGMVALETTGVPALRRSYDAFEAGDPRQGIYEGIWGGLGLAGTLGAIPGARRAPRAPMREPVLPQMREAPTPPPGNVLPVRPPQPFRQSLIGGADDLTGASRGVFSEGPQDGLPPRAPDAGPVGGETLLSAETGQMRPEGALSLQAARTGGNIGEINGVQRLGDTAVRRGVTETTDLLGEQPQPLERINGDLLGLQGAGVNFPTNQGQRSVGSSHQLPPRHEAANVDGTSAGSQHRQPRTRASYEEAIEKARQDYDYVGLRTDDGPLSPELRSRVWDDGEPTGEMLDGLSVTDVNAPEVWSMHNFEPPRRGGHYFGENTHVIAGNRAYAGRDRGELVITDPVIILDPARARAAPTREPVLPQMREPPAPPPGSVLPVRPPQPFRQSLIGDAGAGRGDNLPRYPTKAERDRAERAHLESLIERAQRLTAETRETANALEEMRNSAAESRNRIRAAAERAEQIRATAPAEPVDTTPLVFPQDLDELRVFTERLRNEGPDVLRAEQRAAREALNPPDGGARVATDAPTAGPSRPPPDTAKSYRPGPPKGGFFFPRTPVNGS